MPSWSRPLIGADNLSAASAERLHHARQVPIVHHGGCVGLMDPALQRARGSLGVQVKDARAQHRTRDACLHEASVVPAGHRQRAPRSQGVLQAPRNCLTTSVKLFERQGPVLVDDRRFARIADRSERAGPRRREPPAMCGHVGSQRLVRAHSRHHPGAQRVVGKAARSRTLGEQAHQRRPCRRDPREGAAGTCSPAAGPGCVRGGTLAATRAIVSGEPSQGCAPETPPHRALALIGPHLSHRVRDASRAPAHAPNPTIPRINASEHFISAVTGWQQNPGRNWPINSLPGRWTPAHLPIRRLRL